MPQSFNPTALCCRTPWFRKRQLPHYTHFISHYVFSSSPESTVLSLPSCSQPSHLSAQIFATLALLSLSLTLFFFASLSFIFDPFSSSGHWSFWLSPCSLFSKAPPSLFLPSLDLFLSVFFFFASVWHSLKNIKKSSSLSFLFLSLSDLCVVAFLSLCLSLPYRSSCWAVCQVRLNLCQPGGTHR